MDSISDKPAVRPVRSNTTNLRSGPVGPDFGPQPATQGSPAALGAQIIRTRALFR